MPTSSLYEVSRLFDGVPTVGQTILPANGTNSQPTFGQTIEPVSLTTADPTNAVIGDSVSFQGTDYDIAGLYVLDTESIFGGSGSNINTSYTSYVFELVNPLDLTDVQTIWLPDDTSFLFQETETITVNAINSTSSISVSQIDSDNFYFTVCFTRGTLIKTTEGERPVETLVSGDRVVTMDAGIQPIRWIGSNRIRKDWLVSNPKLLPVRIRAGALGQGLPEQDLIVSRQHRVMVRSALAAKLFQTHEVLIPANKLLALDGVEIAHEVEEVEYWHFLLNTHQIIWSNGAPTESLFTGPEALKAVSPAAREEIMTLFPEIALPSYAATSARPIPETGKLMKILVKGTKKTTSHSSNYSPGSM